MSGIEWIVEAHGCEPRALADVEQLRALFARMIEDLLTGRAIPFVKTITFPTESKRSE